MPSLFTYDLGLKNTFRAEINNIRSPNGNNNLSNLVNFLNGHFLIGDDLFLNIAIPIAVSESGFNSSSTEIGIGNLGVGLAKGNFDFKVHLPTADEQKVAVLLGVISSFDENFGSFFPNSITFDINYNYQNVKTVDLTKTTFIAKLRPRLKLFIPSDNEFGANNDTELFFNLSAMAGVQAKQLRVYAALNALTVVTDNSDDRMIESLSFGLDYNSGTFSPGIILRFPLDDGVKNSINRMIGISLKFTPSGKDNEEDKPIE